VAALRSATAFARCVVREEIKGTSLGAFDAGLALLDITEAGTSYRYYIRADRDPECLKALHRIQGFATPAAQRPALAR
jgi:hypothetical protein